MPKTKKLAKCPRCKGPIPNAQHEGQYPGALCRRDNKTYICSECGTSEAMEDAHIYDAYTGVKYWK